MSIRKSIIFISLVIVFMACIFAYPNGKTYAKEKADSKSILTIKNDNDIATINKTIESGNYPSLIRITASDTEDEYTYVITNKDEIKDFYRMLSDVSIYENSEVNVGGDNYVKIELIDGDDMSLLMFFTDTILGNVAEGVSAGINNAFYWDTKVSTDNEFWNYLNDKISVIAEKTDVLHNMEDTVFFARHVNLGITNTYADIWQNTDYNVKSDGTVLSIDNQHLSRGENLHESKINEKDFKELKKLLDKEFDGEKEDFSASDGDGWYMEYYDEDGNSIGSFGGYIYNEKDLQRIMEIIENAE